jgi:tetratricopeptide (TPR) repeat protein/Mrp family chromosome partitioning ATPase
VIDEYLLAAVVSALVSATVEKVGEAGRGILGRLRRRAREDPLTAAALDSARDLPHEEALVAARAALAQLASAAPDVAELVVEVGKRLPPPRQLPPPPALWVDRADELAAVVRTIREGHRPLLVISGLPGVGKSALALRAAAQVCSDMGVAHDGQLYLDLTGPRPVPAEEALGQLLRSLGAPADQIPPTVAEQTALWRTLTAARRLLLVVDGADSAEQVRPLLPASHTCTVLITARTRLPVLAVDGAQAIHLAPLAHKDAVDMLRRLLGDGRVRQDQAAADDLVRICGGLPHALTLTAARLASQPHWSIRDLVPVHQDLPSLEGVSMAFALDAAYRGLSLEAARCFRLVALHPGREFGVKVAAAALATTYSQAAVLLDQLVAADLLQQPAPGRWTYPESAREYALNQASADPDRHRAREGIVLSYLTVAHCAARLLTPYMRHLPTIAQALPAIAMPSAGRAEALGWLEQQRPNLLAVVTESASWSPRRAWQVAYVMWPLFHYNRHHRDREWVDTVAVQCGRQLGEAELAEALIRQGWGRFDRGDLAGGASAFSEALLLAERLDDVFLAGAALDGLGNTRLAQAQPRAAHDLFIRQLATAEQQAETRLIAMALHNLGKSDSAAGQVQQAIRYLEGAVKMFAAVADVDPYNHALATINYAQALAADSRTDQAGELLDGALSRMTELGSPRGQALAHWILGHIDHLAGHTEHAIRHLTAALGLFERCGDQEAQPVAELLASITQRS